MSDLFAFGAARGATRVLFVGAPPTAASVARSTPRGLLRLVVERRPDETPDALGARARAQVEGHDAVAWFAAHELPAQTWDREVLTSILLART